MCGAGAQSEYFELSCSIISFGMRGNEDFWLPGMFPLTAAVRNLLIVNISQGGVAGMRSCPSSGASLSSLG